MPVIDTKSQSPKNYYTMNSFDNKFIDISDDMDDIRSDIKDIEDTIKSNLDIQNKDIDFLKKRSEDLEKSIDHNSDYIYEVHGIVKEDINKTEEKLLKRIRHLELWISILSAICAFSIGASLSLVL